jgi:hypothetical protein
MARRYIHDVMTKLLNCQYRTHWQLAWLLLLLLLPAAEAYPIPSAGANSAAFALAPRTCTVHGGC